MAPCFAHWTLLGEAETRRWMTITQSKPIASCNNGLVSVWSYTLLRPMRSWLMRNFFPLEQTYTDQIIIPPSAQITRLQLLLRFDTLQSDTSGRNVRRIPILEHKHTRLNSNSSGKTMYSPRTALCTNKLPLQPLHFFMCSSGGDIEGESGVSRECIGTPLQWFRDSKYIPLLGPSFSNGITHTYND